MDTVRYKRWVLQVDREATLQAYAATADGKSERCTCVYCRNFASAREQLYPDEFRTLLTQLGIDYRKDAEIWEASRDKSRIRFYAGWFHFIGSIVSVDEPRKRKRVMLRKTDTKLSWVDELIRDGFAICFAEGADLPHQALKGYHLVQLDFYAEVPWVLDEPPGN